MFTRLKSCAALLIILLLASFLRIYRLESVPPAPSLDEVSLGYNAYSWLLTGADEYGTPWPLLLRAYDDWRPALYVYLVAPLVKIFGLTTLAVRLPAIILSLISIWITYLLVQTIFTKSVLAFHLSLVAALLLAISPWHIYLSRLGHEVNLGLALIILAIYFFFKARRDTKKRHYLWWSSIFFGLSFYTYQSQKLITPILIISLLLLFKNELKKLKRQVFLAGILGLGVSLPIFIVSLSPQALVRFQGTSAFSDHVWYRQSAESFFQAKIKGDLVGQVIYNRRLVSLRIFFTNYLSHFNYRWLFWGKADESHKIPYLGLLYPWELPLIILGLIFLYQLHLGRGEKLFLLVWWLAAPLPAAIATQAPHAMRAFTSLPVWQILGALGFVYLLNWVPKAMRAAVSGVAIVAIVVSLVYLYQQYFVVFPKTQSASFQYALNQAIPWVLGRASRYDKIVFSNQDNLYQSYMFFLFQSRYNPRLYQTQGGTYSGGYAETHQIGKFEFRPIQWEKEKRQGKTLWVGNIKDFSPEANTLLLVQNLDGKEAIKVVGE